MGEGKRDRSGKSRQKSFSHGVDKSSSDTELTPRTRGKSRKTKVKERWPFLDGLDVDELARYRRRRVEGHPRDTLGPSYHDDFIKDLVTEYQRAYRASSEDLLKENIWPIRLKRRCEDNLRLEGDFENTLPSYRLDFKEYDHVEVPLRRAGPREEFVLVHGSDQKMETETENSRFAAYANASESRPALVRRNTTLKRDGDFYADTETYSSYVAHSGFHRPELTRRSTSLRMEGDMETMTEKCEKFIEWLNVSRPDLVRFPTNLKLEGEFDGSTEHHEKYIPFVGARRPELLRQSGNLKLEGESRFLPEYKDVFRDHSSRETLPLESQKLDFAEREDFLEPYRDPSDRDLVIDMVNEDEEEREKKRKEEEEEEEEEEKRKKREEEMKLLVSKLENLKGPPLETPEYKDAYKDFPRERPRLMKPEDEIGRADGSKVASSPTQQPRFSSKIDQDPEYKSIYLDCSKEKPLYRKPPVPVSVRPSLASPVGRSSGFQYGRRRDKESPTTEIRSQYVPYGQVPRVESLRMPTNLRLEGDFDLEPEYRNAYCAKRDYVASSFDQQQQQQQHSRMHRARDRSLSASRRKENYWIHNNNSEQFGRINAAEDQDAFQVLNTRIHEDNVVGKPPPVGSRRSSRSSHRRPTHLDVGEQKRSGTQPLRTRSPSPTYRLHVCNVDDEPRGFGRRRRSSTFQLSSERAAAAAAATSPSASERVLQDETSPIRRPYSPSFGKEPKQTDTNGAGHSFVLLDNGNHPHRHHQSTIVNSARRRRTDANSNVENVANPLPIRGRSRTPSNWMPPWYDSTNTI